MPRKVRVDFDDLFSEAAAESVDQWVDKGRRPQTGLRKPGPPRVSPKLVEQYKNEATRRSMNGDWEGARPQHLVGLYMFCHNRVYGVLPVELNPDTFNVALSMANKQLRQWFDGDLVQVVEFMRWVWDRERNRRDYLFRRARESGGPPPEPRRIGWRLQFSATSPLVTDYFASLKARQ